MEHPTIKRSALRELWEIYNSVKQSMHSISLDWGIFLALVFALLLSAFLPVAAAAAVSSTMFVMMYSVVRVCKTTDCVNELNAVRAALLCSVITFSIALTLQIWSGKSTGAIRHLWQLYLVSTQLCILCAIRVSSKVSARDGGG